MRIPTYTQFKRQSNLMSNLYDKISVTQEKIDSGKRILNSSEDPLLSQRIKSTGNYINYLESFSKSQVMAKSRTSLFEANISGSLNEINRVNELVKSAQNDTLNNSDRLNIAKEIEGILNNIERYANTRDANGEYIFSGNSSSIIPFQLSNQHYVYAGSNEATTIPINANNNLIYAENGARIFGDLFMGNGLFTVNQVASQNIGASESTVGDVVNQSAYVEDNYTLTFVTNASGQLAYQVTGAKSGQVIPAAPQIMPDDAPAYKSGDHIQFNGIDFSILGSPAAGDQYQVEPSKKQNVFETLNQLVNVLKEPINNQVDKSIYHQSISQLSASIKTISKHFTEYLSEVGYRSKELETIEAMHADELKNQTAILGDLENADEFQLISDLSKEMTTLQLTQQTYVKLQSLFSELMRMSV